jgi:hypothetical protein
VQLGAVALHWDGSDQLYTSVFGRVCVDVHSHSGTAVMVVGALIFVLGIDLVKEVSARLGPRGLGSWVCSLFGIPGIELARKCL